MITVIYKVIWPLQQLDTRRKTNERVSCRTSPGKEDSEAWHLSIRSSPLAARRHSGQEASGASPRKRLSGQLFSRPPKPALLSGCRRSLNSYDRWELGCRRGARTVFTPRKDPQRLPPVLAADGSQEASGASPRKRLSGQLCSRPLQPALLSPRKLVSPDLLPTPHAEPAADGSQEASGASPCKRLSGQLASEACSTLRLLALIQFLQWVRARLPARRPLLASSATYTAHAPLLRHCLDHPALVFRYESCLRPSQRLARASAVARNQRSSTLA